jgi:hypothetical protein
MKKKGYKEPPAKNKEPPTKKVEDMTLRERREWIYG